ncbi:MAG TPA: TPM domain-containing protein [Mycobacteriales bacterium]|nr:TPM domain-containing protein [Mycobacteriales bacterium]
MALVANGDASSEGLTPGQQDRIGQAIEACRRENGLDVSVLVGDLVLNDLADFADAAGRLHAALGERARTAVLLVVAPGQRRAEVVTGPGIRRRVPDRVAGLAVLSMTTAFAGGDLAGGIVHAVRQIADAAGRRAPLDLTAGSTTDVAVRSDH